MGGRRWRRRSSPAWPGPGRRWLRPARPAPDGRGRGRAATDVDELPASSPSSSRGAEQRPQRRPRPRPAVRSGANRWLRTTADAVRHHVGGHPSARLDGLQLLGVLAAVDHRAPALVAGDGGQQRGQPVDGVATLGRPSRVRPPAPQLDAQPRAFPGSPPRPRRRWARRGRRRRRRAGRGGRSNSGAARCSAAPPPRRRRSTTSRRPPARSTVRASSSITASPPFMSAAPTPASVSPSGAARRCRRRRHRVEMAGHHHPAGAAEVGPGHHVVPHPLDGQTTDRLAGRPRPGRPGGPRRG